MCEVPKYKNTLRNAAGNIYVLYTLIFLIVSGIVFGTFIVTGKSFLWWADGAYQHYTYLIYMGG